MVTRVLPGAYVSLNDLSQVPEGQSALTVGYVLKANRGPVNELSYCTSPTDFLKKYTFSGKPSITDDNTFFSILKVLSKTNAVYVSRAARNPLYGGLAIKAPVLLAGGSTEDPKDDSYNVTVTKAVKKETRIDEGQEVTVPAYFMISADVTGKISASDVIQISETDKTGKLTSLEGYYTVESVGTYPETSGGTEMKISIKEDVPVAYDSSSEEQASLEFKLAVAPGYGTEGQKIGDINNTIEEGNAFSIAGNVKDCFSIGSVFEVKGCTGDPNNNGKYTVIDNEEADPISLKDGNTIIKVKETIKVYSDATGSIYYNGLSKPENYKFQGNDLFVITGKDQGAYNNDIAINIVSSLEDDTMVYRKGANIAGVPCTFDTIIINVINDNTNEVLESFTCSRDPYAKTIDGISLYIEEVVKGSAYIQIVNRTNADGTVYEPDVVCSSSVADKSMLLTGGSNGDPVDEYDLVAALQPFKDKTVSLSLLGNGCSALAETPRFQQALMEVADDRKDLMVFLNAPIDYEKMTIPSNRATSTVKYKKDLGNTSFYGCMYTPHVNYTDIYNGRNIKLGSEAVALAGWLDVINTLNYPYAYAGPRNGLVQGVTCDWKIGDESGEAQALNDASVNYVAYDGKVGRYYMQCQNTLQVANSAMRNIGTVLNVLDIKEHFVTLLKEFIQMPITDDLRRDIKDVAFDYLNPMEGVRFYKFSFQDVTTPMDIADNTLRYLLVISPTMYAQKIYLTMNIVNATFDFSIVQSA